ncbi:Mss4-like protein [Aspergillus leporis]|uniref:Mss4-like protein n=1 Tax=Aspergillus leporis TaxID=41062 RepID=A0A5N5WUB0_9EURO|nr:Mss4-like protein [Aspergillus leporis]
MERYCLVERNILQETIIVQDNNTGHFSCSLNMAFGGCFCGKIRIECSGQPITSALCHCFDCRKLTGTLYTYSFIFNSADLKITGSPKEVAKTSDSGNHIKNYFCSDCGTPLYGHRIESGVPDKITIVRAGIFDDLEMLNQHKPKAEIYINGRVSWNCPLEGVDQFAGMLPLQ